MTLLLATLLLAGQAHAEAAGARSLDLFARGGVADVLVTVKTAAGLELRHQRSTDGGRTWSPPVRLPAEAGDLKSAHRGMDPQVAAHGDRLVAVWTRAGTSPWGTGPLGTAVSSDGGRTWSVGPNPADDGATDGHGFADLATDDAGVFYMVWLDSRDGAPGLRGAVSRDGGRRWSKNETLDARTCECCWNRLATSPSGSAAVLYRDADPRDLAVASSTDGGKSWGRRGTAGAFGWSFNGCPHVGGGLAYTGTGLAALAWTGDEDDAGLYALRSEDGGATWSKPVRVGAKTAHRGDLASAGGVLAAVWDDPVAAKGKVLGATSADGGRTWSPARTLADAGAGQPMVAALGPGRFLAAWIESPPGGDPRWRSAPFASPARSGD
jgi:hypothetical protein